MIWFLTGLNTCKEVLWCSSVEQETVFKGRNLFPVSGSLTLLLQPSSSFSLSLVLEIEIRFWNWNQILKLKSDFEIFLSFDDHTVVTRKQLN